MAQKLKPIVKAGLVVSKQNGVKAASGNKSQRTTIKHESKHMHQDFTKLPKR